MNRAAMLLAGRTFAAATIAVPLLVTWLYVGACGHGKHGIVVSARAFGVSVSAAWCSSS